jgi:hypothetical protein
VQTSLKIFKGLINEHSLNADDKLNFI